MSSTPNGAPSDSVTIVFSAYGGNQTGVCRLLYSGLRLTHYLREGDLRLYNLVTRAKRGKVYLQNGSVVHLTYVPVPGDVIVLK